jgi:hypothetical protein
VNKQRVLSKFVENDYEKVNRLMKLFFKYSEEVDKIDLIIEKEKVVYFHILLILKSFQLNLIIYSETIRN